jgi:hypothetical protein
MARLIFLSAPYSALSHLFTIDHTVGHHGVNHRSDVLLVQFFLRALIPTPPGAPAIPVDGHCGRQTINWIRYFQAAYGDNGSSVREAGQRGANQNNLKQIGLAAHNPDGSVRFVGGQNNLKQAGLAAHNADGSVRSIAGGSGRLPTVTDGTSNTIIVGESPTRQDGSSNTIVIGEQPPADADSHVHRHYGTVRPTSYGEPFDARMTIVRLNLAYREAYGPDRFRRIDLDPSFPPELFSVFFAIVHGGQRPREAASRGSGQGNLRQIGV